ncbi:DUF1990 family protein [Symbioplanes lichenis]|uniref:DUF1990 family protein n=1 Tax=Symbioplanes lichenis TaxID=1629072 RepID=UPI002739B269|nr:DUF1990 domain-containing protein [Actinoplanes lichenis]
MTTSGFTYPDVGATLRDPFPGGYRHLRYRVRVGPAAAFGRAAEVVLTFAMQRGTGTGIRASAGRAAPGVRAVVGRGPIHAPCQVVWVREEQDLAGFAYGTLRGHQASGEESFVVERDAGGTWLTIRSFSRPARLPMRALGPAAKPLQHLYARLCGLSLKRQLKVVE